jgi:Zn-dependent peptidase ImmA (M78 family)
MERVEIKPELIQWALHRSGKKVENLLVSFPKLPEWETGTSNPTLKQLENFALKTKTPIGFFFLAQPPIEKLPISDFRKPTSSQGRPPSPDLLDTIYICQQRQEWYLDFARYSGLEPLPFVGKGKITDDIIETAAQIRQDFDINLDERKKSPTWESALRQFIIQADAQGILVMVNGVVGSNNHRKLDPQEFRGFTLYDQTAPLIFINGADTKSAQMFTLAHEIAHIWIGQTGLTDAEASDISQDEVEAWCDKVAAELLVPLDSIKIEYKKESSLDMEIIRLSRRFKVSTLVIIRRIYDAGGISKERMWDLYHYEYERLMRLKPRGGGDFYLTETARVGRRFAQALVISTLEGQTLYRDAFHLLGFSKLETFKNLGERVGVLS